MKGSANDGAGDYGKAVEEYTQALGIKPDYALAYYNQGTAHISKREHAQAMGNVDEAIRLKPDDASSYYNRACVHSLRKEIGKCVENLAKAIELDPISEDLTRYDKNLEWASEEPRVRELLGLEPLAEKDKK